MKTLVVYCTYQINDELAYFINNGYIANDVADFYFCFNGDFPADIYESHARELGLYNIWFCQRPNIGYDFAGWSHILFSDKKMMGYDYYIFVNASCMGPFLPTYLKKNWIEIFTEMIDTEVKLVGPTINLRFGDPHIQSYMFCTDHMGLNLLIKNGIFSPSNLSSVEKESLIKNYEIGLSLEILKAGYKIKSLLQEQFYIDYFTYYQTKKIPDNLVLTIEDDLMMPAWHYRSNPIVQPKMYDVIFFKSNRTIDSDTLQFYQRNHSIHKPDLFSKIIHSQQFSAAYGTDKFKIIITDKFVKEFVTDTRIVVPIDCSFDKLFGDPYLHMNKNIYLKIKGIDYQINENQSFVSNMTDPIYIFWHIYLVGDVLDRQFALLETSSLLDCCNNLFVSLSECSNCKTLEKILLHPKTVVINNKNEIMILSRMKEIANKSIDDAKFLYMHSGDVVSDDWIKMMEFFLIERWIRATVPLRSHYTVGCEMWDYHGSYHYSGSFWWTTASYLKQLPDPTQFDSDYKFWILSLAGKKYPLENFHVLHRTGKNKYKRGIVHFSIDKYPRKYYADGLEVPNIPLDPTKYHGNIMT